MIYERMQDFMDDATAILDTFKSIEREALDSNMYKFKSKEYDHVRVFIFNDASVYYPGIGGVFVKISDAWESLPDDFKYEASFHLDVLFSEGYFG